MANVFRRSASEGFPIEGYVVEDHADGVLAEFERQA